MANALLPDDLRRMKAFANIAMLSGDPVLTQAGAPMLRNAQASEALAAQSADRAEDRAYRESQSAQNEQFRRDQLAQNRELAERSRRDQLLSTYERLNQAQRTEEEKAAERAEVRRDKGVDKLASDFEKGGYSELQQSTKDLKAMLARYEGKNIPGVGGIANVPFIGPGLARLTGGDEGRENQSIVASVRNALLKARSGGAVTDSEATRMMEELQTAIGSGDEDFRKAATRISNTLDARVANLFAGQRPEVVDEYAARGGTVTRSSTPKPSGAGWKVTRVK
jgi:hypothetical protein